MPENESVGSSISVQRGVWADLPPDVAIMLAPPVTVTARPAERPVNPYRTAQLGRSRGNMPGARHLTHAG
ncbi:hypothetical protein SAMN04489716_5595 [Actinoplanes derwentensis]|uniref:Uncharacterized protein n=1 Tax=Actinoplanes derwentensis TaxID=113562 RepID=A0A1H2CCJ7_9ACTN|nr:hypothetical protein Ade03nite_62600 [Actinoplanes derwentensis]SDT68250.1 hypothetical protein SAMN04489716_5595 [Actinoplanes derwentensis]